MQRLRPVFATMRQCAVLVALSLPLMLAGCGGGPLVKAVDAELAKDTLKKVLDTWQRGGTIAELKSGEPQIVVQEIDWSRGTKLQSYALLDAGREEDANLFCEVELTLMTAAGGAPVKKTVIYVIGTDPVLTVFRAII